MGGKLTEPNSSAGLIQVPQHVNGGLGGAAIWVRDKGRGRGQLGVSTQIKAKHDNQSCFHYRMTFDFRFESRVLPN